MISLELGCTAVTVTAALDELRSRLSRHCTWGGAGDPSNVRVSHPVAGFQVTPMPAPASVCEPLPQCSPAPTDAHRATGPRESDAGLGQAQTHWKTLSC